MNQHLFSHMHEEHGLVLTEDEMEVIKAAIREDEKHDRETAASHEAYSKNGGGVQKRELYAGGIVPKKDDTKKVLLSRGWVMCGKCGNVFEGYKIPPLNHICHK